MQVVLVQALGLEKHADAFEREEVELDLVCSLSNADLLELGIADAGVAKLPCWLCGAPACRMLECP